MIIVVHNKNTVTNVYNYYTKQQILFGNNVSISHELLNIANKFPDELIIWMHELLEDSFNAKEVKKTFHHKLIMASFSTSNKLYFMPYIGYIETTPFINVNFKVNYPTWQMSSDIGGANAEVFNELKGKIKPQKNFNYFLNSVAKKSSLEGLFCYSEPRLLNIENNIKQAKILKEASFFELFKFVKQHYKWVWAFFLFLSFLIDKRKFLILPLVYSIFFRKLKSNIDFSKIEVKSSKKVINKKEVDIVIPTLGRKKYLYGVLKDLSVQTILPKNVIIVEQNPNKDAISELDYLKSETWPFNIKHSFIHKTGACNARNIAFGKIESEWVLLADDDIRFKNNLIEKLFNQIEKIGINVLSTVCIKPNEKQTYFKTTSTTIFGSGNSILKSKLISKVKFDINFEFGYGEDRDFGMQLRNMGEDIIFTPNVFITHLKAPIGGFREKIKNDWDNDIYQLKPSPTVMLFSLKHFIAEQIFRYKLFLFISYYKIQPIKRPFKYVKIMKKRWNKSIEIASQLRNP